MLGNSRQLLMLFAILMIFFVDSVSAVQDVGKSKDHPLLSRYPGPLSSLLEQRMESRSVSRSRVMPLLSAIFTTGRSSSRVHCN
jgi:hypothetical protein